MKARYHYKRRTIGRGKPTHSHRAFHRQGQIRFGPWQTVSSHDTLDDALRAMRASCAGPGCYDRAIFYRGRQVDQPEHHIPIPRHAFMLAAQLRQAITSYYQAAGHDDPLKLEPLADSTLHLIFSDGSRFSVFCQRLAPKEVP